jgi:hypothetical protein
MPDDSEPTRDLKVETLLRAVRRALLMMVAGINVFLEEKVHERESR